MKNIGTKKLFERKAYELFVPILIILLLGFITVSVGGLTNTRKEKSLNRPLYVANDNIIPISHNDVNPLEKTTLRQTDSIAALDKAPRKEYQVTPPALHLSRDGSAEKEKYIRHNWTKYMTLTNSQYKHRRLGGIKGLSITFTNNTDYLVDEVVAEVTYIKANGKPWKTKLLSLLNITPHSEKLQEFDKVSRGKSVKISIKKINSSSLHFTYDRDQVTTGNQALYY